MKYYVAYGSNLNVSQMSRRCPDAVPVGTARIPDYQLLFRGSGSGAYLTVEPCEGASVPVAIWRVSAADEERLDRYEGCPRFYYKKHMALRGRSLRDGRWSRVSAFVYIMHEDRPLGVPADHYVRACLAGYENFNFDPAPLLAAVEKSKEVLYEF